MVLGGTHTPTTGWYAVEYPVAVFVMKTLHNAQVGEQKTDVSYILLLRKTVEAWKEIFTIRMPFVGLIRMSIRFELGILLSCYLWLHWSGLANGTNNVRKLIKKIVWTSFLIYNCVDVTHVSSTICWNVSSTIQFLSHAVTCCRGIICPLLISTEINFRAN